MVEGGGRGVQAIKNLSCFNDLPDGIIIFRVLFQMVLFLVRLPIRDHAFDELLFLT